MYITNINVIYLIFLSSNMIRYIIIQDNLNSAVEHNMVCMYIFFIMNTLGKLFVRFLQYLSCKTQDPVGFYLTYEDGEYQINPR